ncbi:TlpA family protein disulfide reductase [Aquimarina sp. SS2-1]|uniref:TlpA family protein disulfide reductase n=1 Tax=Aquimarina besae TaxID=3342247 RepID=UPI00366D1A61
MKSTIVLLLIIFLAISCKRTNNPNTSIDEDIEIDLKKQVEAGPFSSSLLTFRMLDSIPTGLKGMPKLDTIIIQSFVLRDNLQPDSIYPNTIYAYSGYKQDKIVVGVDHNFNYDFGDDPTIYFDRNQDSLERFETTDKNTKLDTLVYQKFVGNTAIKDSLIYKVLLNDGGYQYDDPIRTDLTLLLKFHDHWLYGEFRVEDLPYKVAYIERNKYIKDFSFAEINNQFPTQLGYENISYRLKDTINLSQKYFRIDSFTTDFSKLFLKDLKLPKRLTGYREGEKIKDLEFKDLSFSKTRFSKLLAKKDYLLIDFWGTWCAPCIKITPDVIQLKEKYADRLTILSFAYDVDIKKVFEHIKKYKMDWNHAFIQKEKQYTTTPQILDDLRIVAFPTFVLIDKDLNIIARGSSPQKLTEIGQILSSQ